MEYLLQLQENESLSINTDQQHFHFVQDLAQRASEVTKKEVHVVIVTDGKPSGHYSYTPQEEQESSSPITRGVLLRIDDTEKRELANDLSVKEIVSSPPLLQMCGNLGSPQLNKEVAPWAVVALPGTQWAQKVLHPKATEEELWKVFDSLFFLSSNNFDHKWNGIFSAIKERALFLNRLEIQTLHIQTDHTDLYLSLVEESRWRSSIHTLSSDRHFASYIPPLRVSALVHRNSVQGVVKASEDFYLFGKLIKQAQLTFFQGELTNVEAEVGLDVLLEALAVDEGASRISEISIVNPHPGFEQLSFPTGYSGFDDHHTTTLALGMGEVSHLEDLDTYEDEKQLEEQTGCNTSLLHLRFPIGHHTLSIEAITEDGEKVLIVSDGMTII
ncbi:MAG: aminopeptidase [Sphaerochaetaceae bacterium]